MPTGMKEAQESHYLVNLVCWREALSEAVAEREKEDAREDGDNCSVVWSWGAEFVMGPSKGRGAIRWWVRSDIVNGQDMVDGIDGP